MDFRIITLPLAALLALAIYSWSLQPLNAVVGMLPIDVDLGWIVLFVVWMMLAATVMPRRIDRPSDLFLLFYVIICLPWGGVLWNATGLLSLQAGTLLMVLLYLPAFAIKACARLVSPMASQYVMPVYLFRPAYLSLPLLMVLAAGAVAALSSLGDGSFGIDNVYERRLAGRDALSGSVIAAYLIPMSLNGAAPLLAFMAGWRRSPLLIAAALAFALLMFWLLGLKSPFINIAALFGVGFAFSLPMLRRVMVPLGMACLLVLLGAVCLQVAGGSYSAVADYVLRRIIMVQPEVQSYYIDYFLGLDLQQKLFGTPLNGHADWTFLIGEAYFHNPNTNADTNGLLHALMRGGLVGYAIGVLVVSALMMVIDALFEQTRIPEFMGVAGLYGILVSEQSYTTALLTSGVALCLALIILFSYPSPRNRILST